MKAEELDAKFDAGESVLEYFDLSTTSRGGTLTKNISIALPIFLWRSLEQEAHRQGLKAETLVQNWIADQLEPLQQE
jgi:hypothetical protein